MKASESQLRTTAEAHGQGHVFRFWDELSDAGRENLLADLAEVDFPLMDRLIETWVRQAPAAEQFDRIEPVPCIPVVDPEREDAREALAAGEAALREGRIGLFLVAGGQGTRLGFDGPKGSYPIGALTGKSLFQYHAEKIRNIQRRYGCILPWYIMVSRANGPATRDYFEKHDHFGLNPDDIYFITQHMVPCVDDAGKFMLESKDRLAMNPNGHGGCIQAMVEGGVLVDARKRGIDTLSFFQVDNWAVKVADPYFIGYHLLADAEMSSKNHRKHEPREAVGVHCLCDGVYHVIEYSELDIYPQLLETDADGNVVYYAGNPAIHMLAVDFVQQVYDHFERFPWHRAHKKIPHVDANGQPVSPSEPNGYKFETFVFDALQLTNHPPVALEIEPAGEYTPTKQFEGPNSVLAARESMTNYWAQWLDAAGQPVPRDAHGKAKHAIEISPLFALTQDEFVEKSAGITWPVDGALVIKADGTALSPAA